MKAGIACLVLGYMLSQFYRAFLPVLSPYLAHDLGTTSADLARASGLWFVAFALAQLPIGWCLDRIGPRLTAALPLALFGGGGVLLFGLAQGPGAITWAMVLIGAGCAPVLVAAYYIYAREFSPAVFGTLAGTTIGVGSLGNIAGTLPMAWAAAAFGWRAAVLATALVTLLTAAAIFRFTRDPARIARHAAQGGLGPLLRAPSLWFIAAMMIMGYAPAADIRGLWLAPHLSDLYSLESSGIGQIGLLMGLAMIAGNFAYGPIDRLFGTRKWGVFGGNLLTLFVLLALALWPGAGIGPTAALFAALGVVGASYPAVMAHGRAFFPSHLVGRGVTFLTLIGIGGTGALQVASGWVHSAAGPDPALALRAVYLFFAGLLALALLLYAFSADRRD